MQHHMLERIAQVPVSDPNFLMTHYFIHFLGTKTQQTEKYTDFS